MADYKLLIGGQLVAGDAVMDVINPATEEVLAVCPRASEAQLDAAVAAGKAAFPAWAHTPNSRATRDVAEARGRTISAHR